MFDDSIISFPSNPTGLYDPLRYMIGIGGKRIRPNLCLLAYSLYGGEPCQGALEAAQALEIFHSFTLIHDDIMDHSPLRRGVPTVWKKWSEDTAILSGDVMLIEAYKHIVKVPQECRAAVVDLFSSTAGQVCEGQQYDMEFEALDSVSMSQYENMIALKTAVLIACAAKTGALVAGAPQKECEALYRYGYNLGLAFQIADDYLDTYGDLKVFGKPIGGDIVNNKKTWLLTKALETAKDRGRLKSIMALPVEEETDKARKVALMRAEYDKLGIPQAAAQEIRRLSDLALEEIADIPGNDILKEFSEKLIGRAK